MSVSKNKAKKKKPSHGKAKKKAGGRKAERGGQAARGKAKKVARGSKPAKGKVKASSQRRSAVKGKPAKGKAAKGKPNKAQLEKERKQERALKEREKAQAAKLKDRERKDREREKAQAAKLKDRERKDREREKAQLEKERAKAKAEQEKLQAKKLAEKLAEKNRAEAAKEAAKVAAQKAREAEKARVKAEKEAEKQRVIAEREAEKEAIRKAKEDERTRRDAERDAYRKAKEAERERLRAEKEAARRARESKIARASKNAQRENARMAAARVYDPAAIPNQSGTTRRAGEPVQQRLVGVRLGDFAMEPVPVQTTSSPPSDGGAARPTPLPPTPESVEERYRHLNERLGQVEESFRRQYDESFEMSWIHHDSALEGLVYTFQELKTAMDPSVTVVPDSSMQPVCEEIRRHRQAIAYVRELGERKRVPVNVDVIKKIYVILHPEEGDVKTVKYRKDIPQHRLYFHEYAAPDKIAYRVRQVMDWLNGPEPKKIKSPVKVAARVHFDLVRIFPFPQDSGKVARLLMNILLIRAGYPPAIIHSTERQRYYEALKGQLPIILMLVNESITNALMSIDKLLDEHETRVRA